MKTRFTTAELLESRQLTASTFLSGIIALDMTGGSLLLTRWHLYRFSGWRWVISEL